MSLRVNYIPKKKFFSVREIRSIQGQLVRQGDINDYRTILWQETRFLTFPINRFIQAKSKCNISGSFSTNGHLKWVPFRYFLVTYNYFF